MSLAVLSAARPHCGTVPLRRRPALLAGALVLLVAEAHVLPSAAWSDNRSSTKAISTESSQSPPGGEPACQIVSVEIGVGGEYKVGEWTAVSVRVMSEAQRTVRIVAEAPDADDHLVSQPGQWINLAGSQQQRVETCFRTGRLQGELLVRLEDENGHTLDQRRFRASDAADAPFRSALRHDVPLWVTLAALDDLNPAGPDNAPGTNPDSLLAPRLVRVGSLRELPRDVRGWSSVDVVLFPTAKSDQAPAPLEELTPEDDALLRGWVRQGGRLIVLVGSEQEAFRRCPLAEWIPARVEGRSTVRQLNALEAFSGLSAPLKFPRPLAIARLAQQPTRNTLLREGAVPLIVAVPYGFGQVTLVGADLDQPPLANWPGRSAVFRKLAGSGGARGGAPQPRQSNRQLSQTGVSDLATQLQASQEDFPSVARPSHWWVMGMIAAYLLLIGPLDYLIVHRLLKRPELTWLTFACLAIAGVAAAAWGAGQVNGRAARLNQTDLVDYDSQSGTVRGRTWVSLYGAESRRLSVQVTPHLDALARPGSETAAALEGAVLTWCSPPENSVSGVYRAGQSRALASAYRLAAGGSAVENLPLPQWSTKTLCSEWLDEAELPLVDSRIDAIAAGQIAGTITHRLPGPLEDVLLVVGGWAWAPTAERGAVAPGVAWQPSGPQGVARDLKALLTGERRTRKESGSDRYKTEILTTTDVWNPFNHNRMDLVQMLSFHQAAGGSEYTALGNFALRELELTHLMQLGRGILVGRIRQPLATVAVDGATVEPTEHETFVRLIVPVRQAERAPARHIPKPEG